MGELNRYTEIKEIKHLSNCLLLLFDGRLASDCNNLIKIYNLSENYNCELIIQGHDHKVTYISQLDNGNLASSSADCTVKLWLITKDSYQCITTMERHIDYITKVIQLDSFRIASCSWDKTITIWNSIPPFKCIHTLEGHKNLISSILFTRKSNSLFSCSSDSVVLIWNLPHYQCIQSFKRVDCCSSNSIIEIDDNRVIIGGVNKLTIINTVTFQIETKMFNPSFGSIYCFLLLRSGNILFAGNKGIIIELDINSFKCIGEKNLSDNRVICALENMDNNCFVSGTATSIQIFKSANIQNRKYLQFI